MRRRHKSVATLRWFGRPVYNRYDPGRHVPAPRAHPLAMPIIGDLAVRHEQVDHRLVAVVDVAAHITWNDEIDGVRPFHRQAFLCGQF